MSFVFAIVAAKGAIQWWQCCCNICCCGCCCMRCRLLLLHRHKVYLFLLKFVLAFVQLLSAIPAALLCRLTAWYYNTIYYFNWSGGDNNCLINVLISPFFNCCNYLRLFFFCFCCISAIIYNTFATTVVYINTHFTQKIGISIFSQPLCWFTWFFFFEFFTSFSISLLFQFSAALIASNQHHLQEISPAT